MVKNNTYEKFPLWMVCITFLHTAVMYGIGVFILSGFGGLWAGLYIFYCIWIEWRVMMKSCKNCYYYNKFCCLGRGKLAPLFVKKGDPKHFWDKEVSWFVLLPDMLIPVIPIICGIVLLMKNFSLFILFNMVFLIFLATIGNALIRGSLACKFCKQRDIGCPAEKMFNKEKRAKP